MDVVPKIGDKVRLNDEGMRSIGGLRTVAQVAQAARMTVTHVDPLNLTSDCITHAIYVDQPLINVFVLTNHDVEYCNGR